ncbi:MAG: hydrolase [Anaerolineae bacterium]|nr:hydrolase [Gloeobacterales cyanobacterium ES-bin-313]
MAAPSVPACPCCGYLKIAESGGYEICPVCGWEDDPLQADDPLFSGGANEQSLNEARVNFMAFNAISKEYISRVRPPKSDELP